MILSTLVLTPEFEFGLKYTHLVQILRGSLAMMISILGVQRRSLP